MTEYFIKSKTKIFNEDPVLEMEGPKSYDAIDMGFGYLKEQGDVF